MIPYSRPKLSDFIPSPRVNCLKTTPFRVAHTYIAHIWQFTPSPPPPGEGSACNDFSCDYRRRGVLKGVLFSEWGLYPYKWGGCYKMFLFCQSNNETTFNAVSARPGRRTGEIQWGRWDCKSTEMIVAGDRCNRLPCWSSQAQPRGYCLANNITRLFGRRLS